MTIENKVALASRVGRARQWATGLFYRKEGRKLTVITRTLSILSGVAVLVICVVVMIFGSPETIGPERKSDISAPQEVVQADQVNVPSSHDAGQTSDGRQRQARNGSASSKYTAPQVVRRNGSVKIPPRTMCRAVLVSGASDGPVRAEVKESFSLHGETLIEDGTVLLGVGQSTDERLFIRFSQMVFKDGGFTSIQAQACDPEDKIAGLKGSKVGTQAFKLAASIGLNFVGGMSQAFQESDFQGGFGIRKPNARNALLNGASTAALEQSQEMMNDYRNRPPKMEVAADIPVFVLFEAN